jgi:hypothetical protein
VNVANPNCGPAPTTNTAVTTSLFTTMAGALINPQSAMPGLLSTVMGAASGGGGIGGATAQPTQC